MINNELRPYEKYKKSEAGYISCYPDTWDTVKLRFVLEERKEKNKLRQTTNILSVMKDKGVILYSEKGNVGNKCSEDIERYNVVYPDDIVMNCMNVIIGSVGRSKYYGALSQVYYVLKNRDELKYNMKYYENVFKMQSLQKELTKFGKGILAHRMRVPMEMIKNLELPLPPINEQDQIVKYLDNKLGKLNKIINSKRKIIALLKEQKGVIISESVSKGINTNEKMKPSGFLWLYEIPYNWECKKFSRVAQVKSNLVSPGDYLDYIQISPENIEKNTGKLKNYNNVKESGVISGNHLFRKGQLLYSKVRPKLNKVTIAPFDGLCSADMYPIETKLVTKYLQYFMLSDVFLRQLAITYNRVKMPKINKEELSSIIIVVPPKKIQIEIVEYLDSQLSNIDRGIDGLEREIELLSEYRNRLVSDVVTGKVDVRSVIVEDVEEESFEGIQDDEDTIEEDIIDDESLEVEDGDE